MASLRPVTQDEHARRAEDRQSSPDEAARHADEVTRHADEAARHADEAARHADEAAQRTQEAAEHSDGQAEHRDEPTHQEEPQRDEPLAVISLVLGITGLVVGFITIYGLRGITLALGIVAVILAATAVRRATTSEERGTAFGGIALGLVTLVVGIVVVSR